MKENVTTENTETFDHGDFVELRALSQIAKFNQARAMTSYSVNYPL
jgi:hypothetical protein